MCRLGANRSEAEQRQKSESRKLETAEKRKRACGEGLKEIFGATNHTKGHQQGIDEN